MKGVFALLQLFGVLKVPLFLRKLLIWLNQQDLAKRTFPIASVKEGKQ